MSAGVAGGMVGSVVGFLGSFALVCHWHITNCGLTGVVLAGPLAAVGVVIGAVWTGVSVYARSDPLFTRLDAWLIVCLSGIGGVLGAFAPEIGSPVCFLGICGLPAHYVTAAVGLTLGLLLAGGVAYPWRKRFRPQNP